MLKNLLRPAYNYTLDYTCDQAQGNQDLKESDGEINVQSKFDFMINSIQVNILL
jgi:hypothetical protein